tara:strand:+ start:176 stop:1360 length:1185 start_codon:yes stop_codon:yes gene_type:complete
MNIIGNKKKIAIIGRGTAGSLALSHFKTHTDDEIVWHYDSNIPNQTVGEGSTLVFPPILYYSLGLKFNNLKKLMGTPKFGIRKINWGGSGDFMHDFPLGNFGVHFDSTLFHDNVFKNFSSTTRIVDQHIDNLSNIDASYIIDCSGKKFTPDEFTAADSMAVNSAFITQCYWDFPKFDYTLTIARPYGWVFGIPLQNRCSIGYIFNKNINSLEEVKEDIKNIFNQFNLTPSNKTKYIEFNNYYRKQNFTDRIAYNGNASFFLEPLEATSIGLMQSINKEVEEILHNKNPINNSNNFYNSQLIEIQIMILLHYLAGSKFSTPFWDNAYEKSLKFLEKNLPKTHFLEMYKLSKECVKKNITHIDHPIEDLGQWGPTNYNINLKELNLYNKLDKLLNL